MSRGLIGVDSSYSPVTDQLVDASSHLLRSVPEFWGRYLATSGVVEFNQHLESEPLARHGIRLLPIARRTGDVGGSAEQGVADAIQCARDLLGRFDLDVLAAQGGQFLVFLDVEAERPLAESYYAGWSDALVRSSRGQSADRVRLLPCVYASRGDTATWQAITSAAHSGAACHGAWVARYRAQGEPDDGAVPDWDPEFVMPATPLPCEVLLWQYAADRLEGQIDLSQTNPLIDIQSALLSRLIMPR